MSKWGWLTHHADRSACHDEVWVLVGVFLGVGVEDLRKSNATFAPVPALALQRVSSSYNLSGKLSPHTQSAALSAWFPLLEWRWRNEFKCKKATQLLAKKKLKRILLSKYKSSSFDYINTAPRDNA